MCMVSDIGMPGRGRLQAAFARFCAGRDRAAGTPAIALTAFARSEDRQRVMLAGFDMHIANASNRPELVAVIVAWLRLV